MSNSKGLDYLIFPPKELLNVQNCFLVMMSNYPRNGFNVGNK